MSQSLNELLFAMRQHSAFRELLEAVEAPPIKDFKPSGDPVAQYAEHIFRSGAKRQDEAWRQLLIGEPTSDKEKS